MAKTYYLDKPEESFLIFDNGELRFEEPENWPRYTDISSIDTVIVKIGTNVITHRKPRRTAHVMRCAAEDLIKIKQEYGKRIAVVSSGAIGLGRKLRLRIGEKIPEREKDSAEQKREDAIYGQDELYRLWMHHFYPLKTGEVLITHQDIRHKDHLVKKLYQNLEEDKIPIINEDDKRSLEEIEGKDKLFWDNDGLASLLAQYISQDGYNVVLMILTNQDGIYTRESYGKKKKEIIRVVRNAEGLEKQIVEEQSSKGRGGMLTKIIAARDAANAGVHVVIANGMYCNFDGSYQKNKPEATRDYRIILDILKGKFTGTWFMPEKRE